MEDNEYIADLIRKCLALAESPNEYEAAAAMSKAQELLEKYNLNMAEVAVEEQATPELFKAVIEYSMDWKCALYHGVALLNFCRVITTGGRKLYLLGRLPNVVATHDMAEWLILQIDRLALGATANRPEYTFTDSGVPVKRRESSFSFANDFRVGAMHRVCGNLRELSKEHRAVNPDNVKALVVNLEAEVLGYLNQQFPNRHDTRRAYNHTEGYNEGYKNGDKVGLVAPSHHINEREGFYLPAGNSQ